MSAEWHVEWLLGISRRGRRCGNARAEIDVGVEPRHRHRKWAAEITPAAERSFPRRNSTRTFVTEERSLANTGIVSKSRISSARLIHIREELEMCTLAVSNLNYWAHLCVPLGASLSQAAMPR